VAPALIPRKPGDRVKTNRRDARKLVELGRAGLLTAVQPPTPDEEAVRDLARARDDAREDLQRCRHRLSKLLLRRGRHFAGKNWSQAHRRWLATLTWSHAAERAVVNDYLLAIDQLDAHALLTDGLAVLPQVKIHFVAAVLRVSASMAVAEKRGHRADLGISALAASAADGFNCGASAQYSITI
jgi:hypothetical protein